MTDAARRDARAAAIFLAALDAPDDPPGTREAVIVSACARDARLAADVRSLLEAHRSAGGFLEQPLETPVSELTVDAPSAALIAGDRVGHYEILGLFGAGGMGEVYRARDTRLGRDVALKAITGPFAADANRRARLVREARASAALNHPNIATVYALDDIDGRLYIAGEPIDGRTLRDVIDDGPVSHGVVIAIGTAIAEALSAAHRAGVVHRDLKPENVMLTAAGAVKILDFGLAQLDGAIHHGDAEAIAITADGGVLGTPAYMSPEQLRGEPATAASDLFALGLVLAELATGRHPFAQAGAFTPARIAAGTRDLAGVPDPLRPIVERCLAASPVDRFPDASAAAAALAAAARGHVADGVAAAADRGGAFCWWQFHQAAASVFSVALAIAVWSVRDAIGAPWSALALVAALVGGFGATTLRLHHWFAARLLPGTLGATPARFARAGDALIAASAFATGVLVRDQHPAGGPLLIAAAVVMLITAFVVEPATARAAQRQ
jgi:hypothetical protein